MKLRVNGAEKALRGREESTLELTIDEWPRTMQMERREQDDPRMQWLGTRFFYPGQVSNLALSQHFCEMRSLQQFLSLNPG